MGSVEKRVRNGNVTWITRWREPDGTQRKRSFRRKADAQSHLVEVEGSKQQGRYVSPTKATVGEVAERWYAATGALKPSTRHRYRGLLDVHVLPALGRVRLAELDHSAVQAWVSKMGLSPSSVRQAHRVLHLVLATAVRDRLVAANAADGVRLPKLTRAPRRHLSPDEVARMLEVAGEHTEVGVLLLCGLRMGELVGLRVGDVDHLRRRLNVRRSATEVNGRLVTTSPKTHAERSVAYPARLAEPLTEACAGRGADEPMFTSPKGGMLRAMNWRRRIWDPLCEQAGVGRLTPHEARHSAASLMIASGADVRTVAGALGHSSPVVTLSVYSHLFDDRLDDVAERIDALVPPARPMARSRRCDGRRASL
jgi:integrase